MNNCLSWINYNDLKIDDNFDLIFLISNSSKSFLSFLDSKFEFILHDFFCGILGQVQLIKTKKVKFAK